MNNEKYNGWANYETWNVALWYNNDEAIYDMLYDMIKSVAPEEINDETASEVVITAFKYYNMAETPDNVKLNSKEINWYEIAEDLREWIS
jgi:hypothetical protein